MNTLILIANFFVMNHFIDEGEHIYTLKGVYKGAEYVVVYQGDLLPIDDGRKFYAEIESECIPDVKVPHYCKAISINF